MSEPVGEFRIHFTTLYGEHSTGWRPIPWRPKHPEDLIELQRPSSGLKADDGVWYGDVQRAWVEYRDV